VHTLHWSPDTGAFAVQAVLEELGLPYRLAPTLTGEGAHRRPEFLSLNPMGRVPVLVLPDGTVVTESAAMVLHLCDLRPEAGLLPPPGTSGRATAYRWLLLMATGLYEADLRYYYPDRYTADADGAPGVREAGLWAMDRHLDVLEGALDPGPWLLGGRFSACDLYLFMLALWHPGRQAALGARPRLAALAREVRRRPAVGRIWAQHYPPGEGGPWSTWTG
jgi:glutathione S-transferase